MTLPVASLMRRLPIPPGTKVLLADKVSRRIESGRPRQAVTRMRDGFRMSLNLAAFTERVMHYTGFYDPWLAHAFKRMLAPGDTMIDAGANIGYCSLVAATCVGPTGRVHAFEPIPDTFARLTENIRLNGLSNVTLNRIALSAEVAELEFEVPQEDDTGLALDRLATAILSGHGRRLKVQATTLDEYALKEGIGDIKLAKFDIEGGEVSAIKGMQRILSAHRITYLISEVNVPLLEQQGLPPSAIRDALAAYGYQAYSFERSRGRRRPLQVRLIPVSQMAQPDIYGEYLFVAPGTPAPRMH